MNSFKTFSFRLLKHLIDKGFCARADIIAVLSFQSSTSRTHNTIEMGSNGDVVVLVELVIRIKIDTHCCNVCIVVIYHINGVY